MDPIRVKARYTHCNCCDAENPGGYYCANCRREHGHKLAGRDPETWESLCPYQRAESARYAGEIAAMPASAPPKPISEKERMTLDALEPPLGWRGNF